MSGGATRAESAAETLRAAILNGQYLSGERLVELQIAQQFAVSQNTIRDALRLLEQEGWVVKIARRGVTVRQVDAGEVCGLIAAVEPLALRWAMTRIDKSLRADLRGRMAAAWQAGYANEERQAVDHLLGFHARIGAAAEKPLTAQLLDVLYNQVRLLEALRRARAPRSARELDGLIEAHEALLKLISAGDSDGACAQLVQVIEAYGSEIEVAMGV